MNQECQIPPSFLRRASVCHAAAAATNGAAAVGRAAVLLSLEWLQLMCELLLLLLLLVLMSLHWLLLLLLQLDLLGQGHLPVWSRSSAFDQAALLLFSCSLCTLTQRLPPCCMLFSRGLAARGVHGVSYGCIKHGDGWPAGLFKVIHPPRISRTIFAETHTATQAKYWTSMGEEAGSSKGVAVVVVVAGPRQVGMLLLSLAGVWLGRGG
jgi:hypothetical protein